MAKIENLLKNEVNNYVFPFFWQHGEDEETLRKYMQVIDEANCHAVCVESRPHPDFCGPKWWKDMDVILDEARKRNMKAWILDDSHFPTGYANGAVKELPNELHRQSLYTKVVSVKGRKNHVEIINKLSSAIPSTIMSKIAGQAMNKGNSYFDDDEILDVAVKFAEKDLPESVPYETDGKKLKVQIPSNAETLYISFLTRNAGIHRDYINMMSQNSCRVLIDAVYEPHFAHYKEDFGNTIAGFFSDEPELGNGVYFSNKIKVGNDYDMPWSSELQILIQEKYGESWKSYLPLLYDDSFDEKSVSGFRLFFMDSLTRLVRKNFSYQVGDWCRDHGVEYIGHVIEDNNQHSRTGASLGHYFRGLAGQDMAGIDDIGGQVIPFKEDAPAEGIFKLLGGRDGEFYHYFLGALGASLAAIDPLKKGRCMCEIFGNYGWSEGPRMEKYLADHFMVQGTNRFVPHAFSPKAYPDSDCPPHFYAHGHNPQYKAFGKVMEYINRVSGLISDGKAVCETAVLYNAEAEWMGDSMLPQKVFRQLMEHQIMAHVIPLDVFSETEKYRTKITENGLEINGNLYKALIIPYTRNITAEFAVMLQILKDTALNILFVDGSPTNIIGDHADLGEFELDSFTVVSLENLTEVLEGEVSLSTASPRIRYFHYKGEEEIFYFVNEDDKPYKGQITIAGEYPLCVYDGWNNRTYTARSEIKDGKTKIMLHLNSCESVIFAVKETDIECTWPLRKITVMNVDPEQIQIYMEACPAIDYPDFGKAEIIKQFEPYSKKHPKFSGYIAYEFTVENVLKPENPDERIYLSIKHAGEDAEVFVNGKSAGIQVLEPLLFDVTDLLNYVEDLIRIEVATTLERERKVNKKKQSPTGIWGKIRFVKVR